MTYLSPFPKEKTKLECPWFTVSGINSCESDLLVYLLVVGLLTSFQDVRISLLHSLYSTKLETVHRSIFDER